MATDNLQRAEVIKLALDDLLANALVDPAAHLDPERVARYALDLERLPPVVVFDTDDGLLLADGNHRVAAARRSGLTTIEAEIHSRNRRDALRDAATIGAQQRGVSVEEEPAALRQCSNQRR